MSFTVRFRRGTTDVATFASPTPFVEPVDDLEYDDQEPRALAAIVRRWTITGVVYAASETAAITAWSALKAALETPATNPDRIELLRDGNVADSISVADGFEAVQVDSLASPRSDWQWRGGFLFTVKVSGRKRLSVATTGAGNIAKLELTESWSYDENGLLTHTLSGVLEAASGSAEAIARTLGLTVPGPTFAFVTNGPEGVDVEKLDRADRNARFTSTVREVGEALPGGVAPSFSVATEVSVGGGFETKTVTASASGPGAESAVRAQRPGGSLASESLVVDPWTRSARAVYVQRKPLGDPLRSHRLSIRGGGRAIAWSRMSGNRDPIRHVLSRAPVEIEEEIVVEVVGNAPGTDRFRLPAPIPGLDEDPGKFALTAPELVERGADRSQDRWQVRLSRGYVAVRFADAYTALSKQALAPGSSSTPSAEAQRQGKG